VAYTNQPHREFLYRQAFEVGRHVIGYEVQKVLAAVDLLERYFDAQKSDRTNAPIPIGVAGVAEGGLLALYSAALDPRLKATLVSGYFQEREAVWQEPIYRNVWGLLNEFGDAELAGLIAPRRLVIEASAGVEIAGPPAARAGRRNVAAPGRIANPPLDSVQREFATAAAIYRSLDKEAEASLVMSGKAGHGSAGSQAAIRQFATALGIELMPAEQVKSWQLEPTAPQEPAAWLLRDRSRQKRQLDELQQHVQQLLHRSAAIRDRRWNRDALTVDPRDPARASLRKWVREELIGCLPTPQGEFHARSRLLRDNAQYSTYEILLDVVDEIAASGILLLPKNLAAGEKRPVVVCQHGLESRAIDTLSREPEAFKYYKAFAEEFVQRGFIVYAPQNPYRGGDRFRTLQRMSNPLQRSLFSYIVAQHEQTLRWLATQPFVDAERIAFYGLSYGGKTAMRVPPLVDGYSLSICSGDFTDWARTIASNDQPFSYLFTSEYEIPEWNMAHVAGYAELAMLMVPRPFMVEAGHSDGGQPSDWVAGEFGKVRRHYDQLGIASRAELEFFDGPHTIHGQGTFDFLHRHLRWPHRNTSGK
jgi:dienelactone hydrolase